MSSSGDTTGAPETPKILSRPSLLWQGLSNATIWHVGLLSRIFIYGLNNTTVNGLDNFLNLLKERSDYRSRTRGLVTVSNHICVIDDPLIWGVIPALFGLQYLYDNHRWSLAAHDICFKTGFTGALFTLGRTLPTLRLAHHPNGGPFQPTMAEAVRLLSKIPSPAGSNTDHSSSLPSYYRSNPSSHFFDAVDPFSETRVSYAPFPNSRQYLAPSLYANNSYSWIHIFPEGMTHQTPHGANYMRYFKWGVSRLILEPDVCPDVVPMFVEGTDGVMHESRQWPRWVPRAGNKIVVTFGDKVDVEKRFGDLRQRWKELVRRAGELEEEEELKKKNNDKKGDLGLTPSPTKTQPLGFGVLNDFLKYGDEAVALRIECTRRVREEVLKVRRSRGLPDEDPKAGWAETWLREGPKREGKMGDDAWVRDV